jgi:archaellum component FlaC
MPPTRKDSGDDNNLMLIIGQLLEAAKAASEGLRSVSQEVRSNAEALIGAVNAIETLETAVNHLSTVVHDSSNPANLVLASHDHGVNLAELRAAVKTLEATIKTLRTDLDTMGVDQKTHRTKGVTVLRVLLYTVMGVGYLITTGIAVYAAITQAK